MRHIRKKDSSYDPQIAYTLVLTDGYGGEGQPTLEEHLSVVEHPETFEVVDADIPPHHQIMYYICDDNQPQ